MERPEQDRSGQFANGIFSGTLPGNTGKRQDNVKSQENSIPVQNAASNRPEMPGQFAGAYRKRTGNGFPPGNIPYDTYGNGMDYRNHKEEKKDNTVLIIAILSFLTVLFLAFLVTIFAVFCIFILRTKENPSDSGISSGSAYDVPYTPQQSPSEEEAQENNGENAGQAVPIVPEEGKKAPDTGTGKESGEYYGELRDAVRTDLNYSIEWENYEFAGNNDYVAIAVDYPVIKGEIPNRDVVNQVIANETLYFEEYYAEYSQYMLEGEVFSVYSEGYVTYMDENMVSIVFDEQIATDYWLDHRLFCINIDAASGVVLDNSSILNVDDDFAVDFRIRSREQNSSNNKLDYMTDQEIAYYLVTSGSSILFYTPVGMEVGINYGEDYVTVTYPDYEQYLQKY